MSSVHSSIEIVNAAAAAIVSADARVPPTTVQKKKWGSCWSLYWCFGSYKQRKKIDRAVLVPEPTMPGFAAPAAENLNHSTTIPLPFIDPPPPSSPASFLHSDPPSATPSPAGLLSLTSLSFSAYSSAETSSIFMVGPYAYETELVSPPVFSTFTTEPSTAAFTPPPEPVQPTTPPSPKVPFGQLLSLSLARGRRNSGVDHEFSLYRCEFQPYPPYQCSPGGKLISPGSGISNSGASSPLPDKCPIESCTREAPKDSFLLENEIYEVASLANSDYDSQNEEIVIDHRVSFELTSEDVPMFLEKEPTSSHGTVSSFLKDVVGKGTTEKDAILNKSENCGDYCVGEASNEMLRNALEGEEEDCHCTRRPITLTLGKDFNFDYTKEQVLDKPTIGTDSWWTDKKNLGKELGRQNNWTFFPMLQPGVL